MFSSSTQAKHWTFESAEQIVQLRQAAHDAFVKQFDDVDTPDAAELRAALLTAEESHELCQFVMDTGLKFSKDFKPSMWPSVVWTAFSYFGRFYLHHSPMEYSCKNVMMACFYLAAKVDEFNVSIDEFVSNLRTGDPASNSEVILALEPVLLAKMDFHLTVHCPYRPLEGHFIDAKTRCPEYGDYEALRQAASDFLWQALRTDIGLLAAPSQIALAALVHSASQQQPTARPITTYLTALCDGDDQRLEGLQVRLDFILDHVQQGARTLDCAEVGRRQQQRARQWLPALDKLNGLLAERNGTATNNDELTDSD